MLVDDDPRMVAMLKAYVQGFGYEVVGTAHCGEDSLETCERLRPDIVLMDIMMPGKMDGIDAAKIIRSEYGIPVIFVTAVGEDKTIAKAKCAEPYGYIVKPVRKPELKAAIEIAIYRREVEQRLKESDQRARHPRFPVLKVGRLPGSDFDDPTSKTEISDFGTFIRSCRNSLTRR